MMLDLMWLHSMFYHTVLYVMQQIHRIRCTFFIEPSTAPGQALPRTKEGLTHDYPELLLAFFWLGGVLLWVVLESIHYLGKARPSTTNDSLAELPNALNEGIYLIPQ